MNLIEELAKQLFYNSDSSDYDEEWGDVESSVKDTFKEIAVDFLPIFAEWIKQVKNPYEQIEDCTDIRYGQYTGFKKAITTILSELEKMKC